MAAQMAVNSGKVYILLNNWIMFNYCIKSQPLLCTEAQIYALLGRRFVDYDMF